MSSRSSASNLTPAPENWPTSMPRSLPLRQVEESGGQHDPRTNSFITPPRHPIDVIEQRMSNPMLRPFGREFPTRTRVQWNMQLVPEDDNESMLTQEEQLNALKKLKKQVYNPYPKSKNNRWCLYYRDIANDSIINKKKEKEKDEDGKRCAICLEDFVPKEEVLVTPCNHMFHDNCIVPWVKSHGRCPVCRFVLGEWRRERRENTSPLNNNNTNLVANDLAEDVLISLLRAMEEAFEWVITP